MIYTYKLNSYIYRMKGSAEDSTSTKDSKDISMWFDDSGEIVQKVSPNVCSYCGDVIKGGIVMQMRHKSV